MSDTFRLSEPDGPLRIEYAAGLMEKIRGRAQAGLIAMPRLGMGVGGLLLGEADGDLFRLLDAIEIRCSHTNGPSFNLTASEMQQAREQIRQRTVPAVVGWYCSRTQGPPELGEPDFALHRTLFPDPGRIALVVRPNAAEFMLAAFYAADEAGELTKRFDCEIPTWQGPPAGLAGTLAAPELPDVDEPGGGEENVEGSNTRSDASVGLSPPGSALFAAGKPPERLSSGGRKGLRWVLGAAALFCAGAAAFFVPGLWPHRPALTLTSTEADGALVMRWNKDAVRGIHRASMSVNDGGKLDTLLLDDSQLNTGTLRYKPKSDRVTAELKAGETSAIAVWLKPLPAVRTPDPVQALPGEGHKTAAGRSGAARPATRRYSRRHRVARNAAPAQPPGDQ